MTTKENCLKKYERLKSKQELAEVFKKGAALYAEGLKIIYLQRSVDKKHTQIGISVPKKFIRKAVERNLIKRRIRNAYRINKHLLENLGKNYLIFFIWTKKEPALFSKIEGSIKKNINFISQKKDHT